MLTSSASVPALRFSTLYITVRRGGLFLAPLGYAAPPFVGDAQISKQSYFSLTMDS